ncbi:hypothetical protein DPEC_G00289700 [Dallia pectoralis]|uniref:Uncharacterized protein n=1 Tax=Dallia pectoralis TaxID=75939 RepID=A0ACC2FH76_DALPE|nr:hypothetical protein DPEC_G00289700 [Dallia pectoralis]
MQEQRNMIDFQANPFLEDGLKSELLLQQRLHVMIETQQQQLQDTEKRQREGLEKRIHQNLMLSADIGRSSSAHQQLDELFSSQSRGLGRSRSTSDLTSVKKYTSKISQQRRQSVRTVMLTDAKVKSAPHKGAQHLHHQGSIDTEQHRPTKEEAECQRKFCAIPVPGHVVLSLYDEMMKTREKERNEGRERRRDFLLSTQKPFSFLERDEKKREELLQMMKTMAKSEISAATNASKPIPKAVTDPAVSVHLKDKEVQRKTRIQQRAQETMRRSAAPIENQTRTGNPEPSTAQRTKKEVLAFLYQKPTFQPKTNSLVPDFDRLHKAFQRQALRRAERTDITKCQPFHLRTSTMSSRPNISDKQHEPTDFLKRSNSFGGLTSLSTDTLPTYITDAARKRYMAIRMSLLQREKKEQESVEFMRKLTMKSEAMKKTVSVHAKVTDPHSSLKQVYHEKIKIHREADQQRMKEYKKELKDIKTRVTARPFLFEQVSQKKAKADAERKYGDKLRKAGLNEQFVKTKGEEMLTTHVLKSDDDCDHQRVENDMDKRYGNIVIKETEEEFSIKTRVENS